MKVRACFLALVAVTQLASAQAVTGPVRGGSLGYAERPGMGSLNPYENRSSTAATDRALSMIYEPLYRYNFLRSEGWERVLAGGEPTRATPAKGGASAWSVALKPSAKWHDGSPVTAADVIFTYNYIRSTAANRGLRQEYADALVDVRQGGSSSQVVFEFTSVVRDPKLFLWQFIIPVSRFSHPTAFVPASGLSAVKILPLADDKDLDRSPMGTGPFRFDRRLNTEQPPALLRFDAYHGGPANLDSLSGRVYLDQATMIQTFLNGRGIQLVVEVQPRFLPQVENSDRLQTRETSSYNVLALALRQKPNSILSNERVRRALTMAINREQILKNWFGDNGEVVASPVMSAAPFFDAKVTALPFDVAQAKRELQGARVAPGTTLKLIYKNVDQGSDTRIGDMVTAIRESLEEVGIRLTVVKREPDYYNGDVQRGDYDLALVEWEFNPAYNLRQIFHSEARENDGLNVMQYSDAQLDRWLESYDNTEDRDQALSLMSLIQRRLNEKAPAVFLVSVKRVYAYDARFTITEVDPFNFFTYAGQWWLNKR